MGDESPEVQGESTDQFGMYDKYLEQFPEEYRDKATEVFKTWDADVTKKFQEYEPYKQFQEYDPNVIMAGLNLLSRVADNPKEVYDLMAQTYGFSGEDASGQGQQTSSNSGQGVQQVQPTNEEPSVDYAAQIEELRQLMAEQQQARENDAAMQEFQGLLSNLKGQYGDYDEDYVLSKIAAGADPEVAVKSYFNLVESIGGKPAQPNYPVLGGQGGVPSNDIDFAKMGSKETKDIIAQMLQRAQQS